MAFVLSKLLWAFLSPGSLLIFMLAGGWILRSSPHRGLAWMGVWLGRISCTCLLAIVLLPVGDWLLTPLENRFQFQALDQVDGIIIIGGDEKTNITEVRGVPTALDSMRRYMMFTDMVRRYPDAQLVFAGGSGLPHPTGRVKDYEVARDLMSDMGVPVERMVFEKNSRNTYENAVFAADIVHPSPQQKWLLVTSAWHMPRAMACFRKAGWNVFPAPTGYFTNGLYTFYGRLNFDEQMHEVTMAMHEYIGLLAYRVMGRTNALWPS